MAVLPGSSGEVPESGNDPSLGGIKWMEGVTEQGVKDRAYSQVFPSMQGAKNSLFGNFIGGIFGGFLSIFQGGSGPSWLPGGVREAAETIRDGQKDLEDRTDLLDKILDHGACYMPTGQGFSGTGRLPFRDQRGPSRGVEFTNNGIKLLGEGAWQIMVETKPDYVSITSSRITYRINCYRPDGSLYTYQEYTTTLAGAHTCSFGADFVVPDPGYFIAVHVHSIGSSWRGHLGGWAVTRFIAKRWSSEFENPAAGGAADSEST